MKRFPTVLILVGIPASGKTTWAIEHCKQHGDFVRISRNDLRQMLRGEPQCANHIEGVITTMVASLLLNAARRGLNVIVDNTNLRAEYIDGVSGIVSSHAHVEFKVFDVPVQECIFRDAKRALPVGDEIIRRMEKEFRGLLATFSFERRPARTWR